MNTSKSITLSLAIATFSIGYNTTQAQPPKQVVSPRALITQVEIAEYRRAIKDAPSHEAKMAIRETTYARLRQRAVERGMVMSEPQPWFGGLHWGEVTPSQRKQQVEVKPVMIEAKPVLPLQTTSSPVKIATVPPPVTQPVAKAAAPLPPEPKPVTKPATKPVVTPHQIKPVLPHQMIPVMLPHPKPVFPRMP